MSIILTTLRISFVKNDFRKFLRKEFLIYFYVSVLYMVIATDSTLFQEAKEEKTSQHPFAHILKQLHVLVYDFACGLSEYCKK